jgi:hypothetical protein
MLGSTTKLSDANEVEAEADKSGCSRAQQRGHRCVCSSMLPRRNTQPSVRTRYGPPMSPDLMLCPKNRHQTHTAYCHDLVVAWIQIGNWIYGDMDSDWKVDLCVSLISSSYNKSSIKGQQCQTLCFHGSTNEERRFLGYDGAVWLLYEPTYRTSISPPSSG